MTGKESGFAPIDLDNLDDQEDVEIEIDEEDGEKSAKSKEKELEVVIEDEKSEVDEEVRKPVVKHKEKTEKRIRGLIDQLKQKTAREQELEAKLAESENARLTTTDNFVKANKTQLEEALKAARQRIQDAKTAGDAEGELEALERLTDIKVELKAHEAWEAKPKPQPTKPTSQGNTKAYEFAQKHKEWFQKDPILTGAAMELDKQLKREGFNPQSDLFYSEIEERLSANFKGTKWAKHFGEEDEEDEEEEPVRKKSPVSGGAAKTPKKSKGPALTASEADKARRLGISYADYYKEKQKMNKAGDGYTAII